MSENQQIPNSDIKRIAFDNIILLKTLMDEAEDFQDRIKISNSNTTALIEDLESATRQLKHATKGLNKMTSEFTSLIMDIKRQLHHNQERIITQTVIANITSLQNEPTL